MIHNLKLIRQETLNECAIACVSMINHYYGYKQPLSYYRNLLRVGRDGASLKDVYLLLLSTGFSVQVLQVDDFSKYHFESGPYIIHLQNSHYIVAQQQSEHTLKILDPQRGTAKMSKAELQGISTGYCVYAVPNKKFVHKNNVKSDFRHIAPIVKKLWAIISFVFVTSLFSYAVTLGLPLLLQHFINRAFYDDYYNSIQYLFSVCLLACIFCGLSTFRNRAGVQLQLKLYESLSFSTIEHLFKVDFSYFDNRSDGDILYRLRFLTQFQNAISGTFIQLIISITSVTMVLIFFGVHYSPLFALTFPILIAFFAIVTLMNTHLLKLKKEELQANAKTEQTITEIITNMLQIRCLHLEVGFWNLYKTHFNEFTLKYKKSQTIAQRYSLIVNIMFTFMPGILMMAILSYYGQRIAVGALFAIFSLLTTLFTQSMGLVTNISSIQLLKASIGYLNDFLDEPANPMTENYSIREFSSLFAENLSFKYSDTGPDVIKDISFNIHRGENVAIVGVSGSGKTTLVKLIAGLYEPTTGSLQVNGIPLRKINREIYETVLSIVPQVPIVFNKSIKDNLTMQNPNVTDRQIEDSLRIAALWDEVISMPQGVETNVLGRGGNLSGGQIQRLSIARALISRPQVIILDEATSSLDSKKENEIFKNLRDIGITSVVITHRLSTIVRADKIIVLDGGLLVGEGTHTQLLESCPQYAGLYQAQAESDGGII